MKTIHKIIWQACDKRGIHYGWWIYKFINFRLNNGLIVLGNFKMYLFYSRNLF